jgi:hypothetical protein
MIRGLAGVVIVSLIIIMLGRLHTSQHVSPTIVTPTTNETESASALIDQEDIARINEQEAFEGGSGERVIVLNALTPSELDSKYAIWQMRNPEFDILKTLPRSTHNSSELIITYRKAAATQPTQ